MSVIREEKRESVGRLKMPLDIEDANVRVILLWASTRFTYKRSGTTEWKLLSRYLRRKYPSLSHEGLECLNFEYHPLVSLHTIRCFDC